MRNQAVYKQEMPSSLSHQQPAHSRNGQRPSPLSLQGIIGPPLINKEAYSTQSATSISQNPIYEQAHSFQGGKILSNSRQKLLAHADNQSNHGYTQSYQYNSANKLGSYNYGQQYSSTDSTNSDGNAQLYSTLNKGHSKRINNTTTFNTLGQNAFISSALANDQISSQQPQIPFGLPKYQEGSTLPNINNNRNELESGRGSKKQDSASKTHLRNIVKYYNSNPLNLQANQLTNNQSPSNFFNSTGQTSVIGQRPPSVNGNEKVGTSIKRESLNQFARSLISSNNNYGSAISQYQPSYTNGNTSTSNAQNGYQTNLPPQNNQNLLIPLGSGKSHQNQQQSLLSSQQQQQQQVGVVWPNGKIQPNSTGVSNSPSKIFTNSERSTTKGIFSPSNQNNKSEEVSWNQQEEDLLDPRMLPKIEKSKVSSKQNGLVYAYGANTHQGLVRPYNEDRVSIILNVVRPPEKASVADWPNMSFFAIYDGHGGANCADFLKDHLHFYIVKDEEFPKNPSKAIHNGFVKAEETFLKMADSKVPLDKSGSCAIVIMIVNETVYVGNLGDSRSVMSSQIGTKVTDLSTDHKPNFPDEELRIIANGGKIYQSTIPTMQPKPFPQFIKGPHRVLPGRLAVSRTVGDAEAKLRKYGGNPRVVLGEPEVTSFPLSSEIDFILLGCDGIFDKLSSQQVIDYVWESIREQQKRKEAKKTVHEYIGEGIDHLIKQTLLHKSFDNVTVVILCLKSIDKLLLSG